MSDRQPMRIERARTSAALLKSKQETRCRSQSVGILRVASPSTSCGREIDDESEDGLCRHPFSGAMFTLGKMRATSSPVGATIVAQGQSVLRLAAEHHALASPHAVQRGLSSQFTNCNVCLRWARQQLAGWRAYCATPTLRGCNRHPIEAFIDCRIRAGVLQHDKYLAAIHRRRVNPLQASSAACWTATPRCAPPIKVSSAPCTWPRYGRSLLHRRSRW